MTTPPAATPRPPEHEERYRALRTVAAIIRVLAYVVAILGTIGVVIAAISAISQAGAQGLLFLVGGLLYVAVVALFLFAYAEIIRLIIAVEDNTRLTAEALAGRGGQLP
jgi:hypothetical protein